MIFSALPVETDPEVVLRSFAIYEVQSKLWKGKTYHFVGADRYGGRCSSAIRAFDVKQMIGVTNSGRVYKLEDVGGIRFGEARDASYVFETWCSANQVHKKKNVTEAFLKGSKSITKNIMSKDAYESTQEGKKLEKERLAQIKAKQKEEAKLARIAKKKNPTKAEQELLDKANKEKEMLDILMRSIF